MPHAYNNRKHQVAVNHPWPRDLSDRPLGPSSWAEHSTKNLGGLFGFLPPRDQVSHENHATLEGSNDRLEKKAYDHPVVIISPKERADGTVIVLTVKRPHCFPSIFLF